MTDTILDFSIENGLVMCGQAHTAKSNSEILYISEAQRIGAYSVFFRRFYREGKLKNELPYKSEPAVCFFLGSEVKVNSFEHEKIHAALWSEGKTDIYIILGAEDRIDIFNSRKPAAKKGGKLNLEMLRLAGGAIKEIERQRYSARLFETGTFWEQEGFENNLSISDSPYIHLLNYLMIVRKRFNKEHSLRLDSSTVDKILIVSILIKFLEEKKDPISNRHTLQEVYTKYSISSLAQAVSQSQFLNILDELASEFNGRIFEQFNEEERRGIKNIDLSLLADFLNANIDLVTEQIFLWEQYSFEHLPPEVISAIYENFIREESARVNSGEKEKGVVYTPVHLVNFLIDEVMPLDKPELFKYNVYKVLDPTCGSGVFLVSAYKRLLQWWTINNSRDGEIRYPDRSIAQQILEDNIFGVDVKETAILVTIFGLTTTLLDFLSPKEIWGKLKFKDLHKENIELGPRTTGFFGWMKERGGNVTYDLVIGNPPFNPEVGVNKNDVVNTELLRNLGVEEKIPGGNFALPFFEASLRIGKEVCMILPANLLYNNSKSGFQYRKHILTDYHIEHIYDFTHLRRGLFHKTADTPVVAVIAKDTKDKKSYVPHTVIKRMTTSEKNIRFEIDHYDRHLVNFEWAIDFSKQFVWKTNLLGGNRLFNLIHRFTQLPTLKDFIEERKSHGWIENRGFEGQGKSINNCDRIVEVKEDGSLITEKNITIKFKKLKTDELYSAPYVVVDQVLGTKHLQVALVLESNWPHKRPLYYNRDFVGISAPKQYKSELKDVYNRLISNNEDYLNYQLYVLSTGSSSLVLTETDVNKSEILNIPFPEDRSELKLTASERVIQYDVLQYYRHLGKSVSGRVAENNLNQPATQDDLGSYAKLLCGELNSIYETSADSWQIGEIQFSSAFVMCQIGFGSKGKLSGGIRLQSQEADLDWISNSLKNRVAIFNRVTRYYDHMGGFDCVWLVKPKSKRYWLGSVALRDADETFQDFKSQGY